MLRRAQPHIIPLCRNSEEDGGGENDSQHLNPLIKLHPSLNTSVLPGNAQLTQLSLTEELCFIQAGETVSILVYISAALATDWLNILSTNRFYFVDIIMYVD